MIEVVNNYVVKVVEGIHVPSLFIKIAIRHILKIISNTEKTMH